MVFSIMFFALATVIWPENLTKYIEISENEKFFIGVMCAKWDIDSSLNEVDKRNALVIKLREALNTKKSVDKRLEELVLTE